MAIGMKGITGAELTAYGGLLVLLKVIVDESQDKR